jgi:cytochrome b561
LKDRKARTGPRYAASQIILRWIVVLLLIEQYATSGAILRTHAYRPLGQQPNLNDLTLHAVHTRVGLLIFVLVACRLLLRLTIGTPVWVDPLPIWRRWLSTCIQYCLYLVLLAQAATGAIATYLWWPISAAHRALFWALVVLVALHVAGAAVSVFTRPYETLFRITAVRIGSLSR